MSWIVGCPQSGKTTLALAEAARTARERGGPVLAIDSQGVHNLARIPARDLAGCVSALWGERRTVRFSPASSADVDRACRAVFAGKDVTVLVDEAHFWLDARGGFASELVRLMRATQHARADLILTSQHLTGDVPQAALSCTNRLCVFRCTSPRVLQTLEREWGIPRELAKNLAQFQYLEKWIGFR